MGQQRKHIGNLKMNCAEKEYKSDTTLFDGYIQICL